jgi:glycosyltransferase involved in cell wall biosynthesis
VHERERILCFATQGHDHLDADRLRGLLEPLQPELYAFDRRSKLRSAAGLVKAVRARRPALVVMEGTGIAGGLALIAIDAVLGVPFVFSSGDAVGPYLELRSRAAGLLGGLYERLLCRRCAGYVGWTPYLVGRALTFGAPRGMTAAGWTRGEAAAGARAEIRARLGIAPDALVVGLVGSLQWNERVGYGYGAELVRALHRVERRDLVVCVLGDGPGLPRLASLAGEELGARVLLPGRVPPAEVPDYLAAFDLASLPQSVDAVGSFRYSTKLSEYLAAGLPLITGEIPAAYDLDEGYVCRLPGPAPWSPAYIEALAQLLEGLTAEELARRRLAVRQRRSDPFDRAAQQRRMSEFVQDILAQRDRAGRAGEAVRGAGRAGEATAGAGRAGDPAPPSQGSL